ncbi:MAG: hypothetical protein AAF797_16940 [Planctomycetota bacterium]
MRRLFRVTGWCAKWVTVVALLLVVAGSGVYWWVQREGSSGLERWVGERVLGFVNERLKPELVFEDLDYQAPTTVVLRNVRLRAADPDEPAAVVDILEARLLQIELAETPERGRPLVIRSLRLESPTVRLIHGKDGALIGFDELAGPMEEVADVGPDPVVETGAGDDGGEDEGGAVVEEAGGAGGATTVPSAGEDAAVAERVEQRVERVRARFSDWLRFEEVELRDARVEYTDRREAEGTGLVLDQVSTRLTLDRGAPGEYGLSLAIGRGEWLELSADLVLDLDALRLRVDVFELASWVSPERVTTLPPQLGSIVKRYGLNGRLNLDTQGVLDLSDWTASELVMEVGLTDGAITVRDRAVDLKELRASATMSGGVLTLERLGMRTMSGRLDATGQVALIGDYPGELTVSGEGLRLEMVLALLGDEQIEQMPGGAATQAAADTDEASQRVWGRLGMDVTVGFKGINPGKTLSGSGSATLEDAELTAFRGLGRIVGALAETMRLKRQRTLAEREAAAGDRLRLVFTLDGDKAVFERDGIRLSTPGLVAARGFGTVWLTGGLDVYLNAGPFERVQEMIGVVGDVWDRLTGGLARYHLTGTLKDPSVALVIAGVETRRPASTQPTGEQP